MEIRMNSALKWGVAVAVLIFAGAATAMPINGTLTLGAAGVSPDPGSLDTITSFASPSSGFYSQASGSFNNLTGGSSTSLTQTLNFAPNPVNVPGGILAGSSNLVLTGSGAASGFGTFTASTAQVMTRSAGFLDIIFFGTYTPDFGPTAGTLYDPNEAASLRIGLTRNTAASSSVSFSGTLAVPPETVTTPVTTPVSSPIPEPASMALLGGGLLGLGLISRRKAS
jgi:hypothetical protein